MRFTVPRAHVRLFVRCVRYVCAVGPSLLIERLADRLVFRALAQSQAAYTLMSFKQTFFENNTNAAAAASPAQSQASDSSSPSFRVRLSSRLVVLAFRHCGPHDQLTIIMDPPAVAGADGSFSITLVNSQSGLEREYRYCYESQANILQADFSRSRCAMRVTAEAAQINSAINKFNKAVEEISLIPIASGLQVKSYCGVSMPDGERPMAPLSTVAIIPATALIHFQASKQTLGKALTFCIREFRSFVGLCESLGVCVHVYGEGPSKPILVTNITEEELAANFNTDANNQDNASARHMWCCELVLATLLDDGDAASSPIVGSPAFPGHANDTPADERAAKRARPQTDQQHAHEVSTD